MSAKLKENKMWLFIGGLVCFIAGAAVTAIFGWELVATRSRSKGDILSNCFILAFFAAGGLWLVIFTATNNDLVTCLDSNIRDNAVRFTCTQTSVWETVSMTGHIVLLWVISGLVGGVIHLVIRLIAYFFHSNKVEVVG